MKKLSILPVVISALIMSAPLTYAEYSKADDFKIQMLSVTDQNGTEIETINADTESVYIQTLVKNPSWNGEAILLAGIFDGTTDKMKYLEKSGTVNIKAGYRGDFDLEMDKSELEAVNVKEGDKIKLYIWDSLTGMQQLFDGTESGHFSEYGTTYSTNNVSDYNMHINEVRGDNWSYLCRYRDMTNTSALLSASMGLCRQKADNTNGTWYTDPNGKTGNWLLNPDGSVKTEPNRLMGFNYTIGALTAEKRLKVSGTFTGSDDVILYVLKTNDSVESVSDYGKGAIGYTDTWLDDNVYQKYENLTAGKGKFEFEIPAEESKTGNDITFWVNRTGGGTQTNILSVTISVMNDEADTVADADL